MMIGARKHGPARDQAKVAARPGLPIAFLNLFVSFPAVFLLSLPLPLLLRRSLALRNVFLVRSWCLLLTLAWPLLWLLPLILNCRASLLRRSLGLG